VTALPATQGASASEAGGSRSPWLVGPSASLPAVVPSPAAVVASPAVPPAEPVVRASARPVVLVGAHGGAGVTTLCRLAGRAGLAVVDGGREWPRRGGEPARVLVVARSSAAGLEAAADVAGAWESGAAAPGGSAGAGVSVEGLVVVADAPGRLPRPLRLLRRLVDGGYPRSWSVPWCEVCRQTGRVQALTCEAANPVLFAMSTQLAAIAGEGVGSAGLSAMSAARVVRAAEDEGERR